eukprot:jgi/Mesvir1/4557/Mv01222-RA.1
MTRCGATTAQGVKCKRRATAGSERCSVHRKPTMGTAPGPEPLPRREGGAPPRLQDAVDVFTQFLESIKEYDTTMTMHPAVVDLSGDDSVVYAKLSEDPVTDGEMRKLAAARALTMGPRHAMQSYVSPPVVDPLGLTNCVTFFMPRKAGNGRRRRR